MKITKYKSTMGQELTSHAIGGLAGSRRTLQGAWGGREMTSWPPS